MLIDKYHIGTPKGSRATANRSLSPSFLNDIYLKNVRALSEIAKKRGQK